MSRIKSILFNIPFVMGFFHMFYRYYLIIFRNQRIKQGSKVTLSSQLEGKNYLGHNTIVTNSSLGYASYISDNSVFINTRIGKFCSIGPDVKIVVGRHPSKDFISTHPAFFSKRAVVGFTYSKEQRFKEFPDPIAKTGVTTSIGNDVWIGAGVSIIDGVTIGDGAIIAAGALVDKDVPNYAIYGGIPARLIKYRFNEEEREFLNNLKWWEKPLDWIERKAFYFDSIKNLKHSIKFDD